LRRIVRWIAILTLVFGAVACSSLKTQLEATAGITGVTVTCPDNIKAEKGATFTCRATAQGETVTLDVTQTDDQGHVTFKVAR
jgi:Domain of unknown function (DUF4333)